MNSNRESAIAKSHCPDIGTSARQVEPLVSVSAFGLRRRIKVRRAEYVEVSSGPPTRKVPLWHRIYGLSVSMTLFSCFLVLHDGKNSLLSGSRAWGTA